MGRDRLGWDRCESHRYVLILAHFAVFIVNTFLDVADLGPPVRFSTRCMKGYIMHTTVVSSVLWNIYIYIYIKSFTNKYFHSYTTLKCHGVPIIMLLSKLCLICSPVWTLITFCLEEMEITPPRLHGLGTSRWLPCT